MTTRKIEMQDSIGNTMYPHTSGDLVRYDDNTSVIEKIDELQNTLTTLKINLTSAINDKAGSSLTSDSTIQEITNKVNSIVTLSGGTSDATATNANILSGKTAYVKGAKVTGTMTNRSNTITQWCGYETCVCQPNPVDPSQGMITFPNYGGDGYYDSKSSVTGNLGNLNAANIKAGVSIGRSSNHGADSTNTITGTFTSDATAVANDMLSGKTAYVKGNKITGAMGTMAVAGNGSDGISYHANALDAACGAHSSGDVTQYVYLGMPQWTYSGQNNWLRYPASTVANKMGLTADKIAAGNTIGGITGTAAVSKNVATLTLTDIGLVTTTADGSGLKFSVDLSSYLNGLSHYIVECNGTCYAYSTVTVASYAVVTPYSSFIKYKDSYEGNVFEQVAPDPTKIVFYRRTNSSYKCTSINFTVKITGF